MDASADIAQKYADADPRVLLHSYAKNRRWAAVNESLNSLKDSLGLCCRRVPSLELDTNPSKYWKVISWREWIVTTFANPTALHHRWQK